MLALGYNSCNSNYNSCLIRICFAIPLYHNFLLCLYPQILGFTNQFSYCDQFLLLCLLVRLSLLILNSNDFNFKSLSRYDRFTLILCVLLRTLFSETSCVVIAVCYYCVHKVFVESSH